MIQLADNLGYQGPKPNFARDYYSTKARLKEVTDHDIDDGHISYCAETGLHYEYKYTNSVDDTYGKWREYKPLDIELSETSENGVQNKVLNSIIQDLKTKYEAVKSDLDNVTDLVQMDEELDEESTRGVQNKVLKKMFDTIGTQIATLENDIKESLSGSFVRVNDILQVGDGESNLLLPDLEFSGVYNNSSTLRVNIEDYPYPLKINLRDEGDNQYFLQFVLSEAKNINFIEGITLEDAIKIEGVTFISGEEELELVAETNGFYIIFETDPVSTFISGKTYKFTISGLVAEDGKPISKAYLESTILPKISDINAQLDNFRKYHLTDDEIEAIYKETRGGILDDISKTRFDEVYEWYKSIIKGNQESPDDDGVDYTSIAERVKTIEGELPIIKSDASAAKSNTLSLSNKIDAWIVDDDQTYGLKNGKLEILVGEGEENLVTDAANAQSLALQSLQEERLVLDGADEKMIEEVRNLLGDTYFNELAANSIQTMELKPQLTFEEQLEQAKAEYLSRKEQKSLNAIPTEINSNLKDSNIDVENDKTI